MSASRARYFTVGSARLRELTRRLQHALGLLLGVVVISTIGFWLLEQPDRDWGIDFWYTLNLISTVGSIETLSPAEQTWAMLVMIFGLGAAFYGFGNLTAILTSGEILHIFEGRRMERQIRAIENHVIVCGFGNTGELVAEQLHNQGRDFVVIELKEARVVAAADAGYFALQGDCTNEELLDRAGVERARCLVTTLDNDVANVFVVLTAKGMSPNLHIVSRANLPATVGKLRRAGADHVTVPSRIAAYQLSHAAVQPRLGSFMARAMGGEEFELIEIPVSDHDWMIGQTVRDLNLTRRADIIVFSVVSEDGSQQFNPKPDRLVEKGDVLVAVGRRGAVDRLIQLESTHETS